MDPLNIKPELSAKEFKDRYTTLHKQVWSSSEFDFDSVMKCVYMQPDGYYLVDPFVVHDGEQWHLFYVTGRFEHCEAWMNLLAKGDYRSAAKIPFEEGEGHAVGQTLFDLKYHSSIHTQFQGEFSMGLQGDSGIVRHDGRWVDVYTARGPKGSSLCLAYSDDLFNWEYEPNNPVLWPPDWAKRPGKFGHSWVTKYQDLYLIYSSADTPKGSAAALFSTKDFKSFKDHGPVLEMPYQMRGTRNIEAAQAICRNGMWHFFYNVGPGAWHAVSDRPDRFSGSLEDADGGSWRTRTILGSYYMGPFHAGRLYQDPTNEEWYMICTRKEEVRRQNREAGISKFRGSVGDESALLQGMFISKVRWEGDQPILEPVEDGATI